MNVKHFLTYSLLAITINCDGQKFKKIFLNLYTDSLKKGTYNYINVDGLLDNGKYIPLDSTEIKFWSSDGIFYGNSLFLDHNFNKEKVLIRIISISQPDVKKEFTMYVKKQPDEVLKTEGQLSDEMKGKKKADKNEKKKKKKNQKEQQDGAVKSEKNLKDSI